MYRNLTTSPGDGSDGSPPSEAWLFAQAILGNPIPRNYSLETKGQDAEARRDREILEWAAQISTQAAIKLRELQGMEGEEREAFRRAELFVDSLLEGNWDPSKHPRAPKGRSDGGQWVGKGGGGEAGEFTSMRNHASYPVLKGGKNSTQKSSVDRFSKDVGVAAPTADPWSPEPSTARTIATTTKSHTNSKGIPILLAAAQKRRGHHWVSHFVTKNLESKMDEAAQKVFEEGTKSPEMYDHAFDTWDGVTHGNYSDALYVLLDNWINACGGMLGGADADKFLSWIATGKCSDAQFAALHKEQLAVVFKWRKAFLQSILVAHAAAEINPKLTAAELKAIAQQVVNGAPTKPLSRAAATAAKAVVAGGKPLLRMVAKRILPGLTFLSAAAAAGRGWAGQGHTGDGAWGAFNEIMRDVMIADVVEPIAFPSVLHTVDGVTNLLLPGLNAPGRNRYIWRGGKRIDLETGQIID